MQFKSTVPFKRLWSLVSVSAFSGLALTLAACSGGNDTTNISTVPVEGYTGVNCVASSGGDAGYVMGTCDVVSGGIETARTTFHDALTFVGSSKASPLLTDALGKALSFTTQIAFDPIQLGLSYGTNTDCATYYSRFGSLRGLTLTQFASRSASPLLDVTSLASVVPGIAGPAPGQTVGPCGNAAEEPSLPPAMVLTGIDFGVYRYYAAADRGTTDASYNGGWFSRLTATTTVPATNVSFDANSARVAAYYSTPTGFWAVSTTPSLATWDANTREVVLELRGSWAYFNQYAVGIRLGTIASPALQALVLRGVADAAGKVTGTITSGTAGFPIDFGRFEGEFNATGTEFGGRFVAKVGNINARIAGAFAFKQ